MVVERFLRQLGPRLRSAFVKGSVARGDAVWGVSDMDPVLAFDSPTPEDTAVKRQVVLLAQTMEGGDALVIRRIWEDRLAAMDSGTRGWWLHSCRHDVAILHGDHPRTLLFAPPPGDVLAPLIAPIIRQGAEELATAPRLDRRGTRHLSKLTLLAVGLPARAQGLRDHVPPLAVPTLPLPAAVQRLLPVVLAAYRDAPVLEDPRELQRAWSTAWNWAAGCLALPA